MTVFVHCSICLFLCQVTHSVTSTWGGWQALRRPVNSNGFIGPLQLALAFSTVWSPPTAHCICLFNWGHGSGWSWTVFLSNWRAPCPGCQSGSTQQIGWWSRCSSGFSPLAYIVSFFELTMKIDDTATQQWQSDFECDSDFIYCAYAERVHVR